MYEVFHLCIGYVCFEYLYKKNPWNVWFFCSVWLYVFGKDWFTGGLDILGKKIKLRLAEKIPNGLWI